MDLSKSQKTLNEKYFEPGSYKQKLIQQFSLAGVANIATRTLLAPLERWRTISQVQNTYLLRPRKFKGFFDYVSRIPKQQGIFSFWRGNTIHCWIYFYQTLFQITLFDNMNHLKKLWHDQSQELPWLQKIQSSFIVPFFTSLQALIIIYPIDTYRIHTMMSYHKNKEDALFTKFRHFFSYLDSTKHIYRGFSIAVLMSVLQFNFVHNLAGLFNSVNQTKEPATTTPSSIPLQSLSLITPQLIVSVLGVTLLHPLDTLRKILQFNNMYRPEVFTGYRSVLSKLGQNKSYMSLFNGMTVSIIRTAMFVPLYWLILEQWKSVSFKKQHEQIKQGNI